ncbi:MAG: P-loop NTPase fold protein [Methanomassiliicoccus sp.]|nr:P-loop NTPase fold protein [Methanomassiliicoccus sp.]
MIISDEPCNEIDQDAFGYSDLANNLALGITKMDIREGFVIGVHGAWGSGKTTFLRYIEHYLSNNKKKQVTIAHFNPWWFSGYQDLTYRFFEMLRSQISSKWGKKWRKLNGSLASFGEAVASAPINGAELAGNILKLASSKGRDLNLEKRKVCKLLEKYPEPIIVFIDDVDRLSQQEVTELFRLIKSVANFPNIIYIVAFDRDVVATMLSDKGFIDGHDYLEKIIQVSFNLPLIEQQSMASYLNKKLSQVIGQGYIDIQNTTYWNNCYYDGIRPLIRTPRAVNRLANNLSLSYPMVSGEVNVSDFISIELIHILYPQVYDGIRENLDIFTGVIDYSFNGPGEKERIKEVSDNIIGRVDSTDMNSVKKLLIHIFPKLKAVYENSHYGNEWMPEWYEETRVCHPDRGVYYFKLVFPNTYLSKKELEKIISNIDDPEKFGLSMVDLVNAEGQGNLSKLVQFQKYLINHDFSDRSAKNTIFAYFQVGDRLYNLNDEFYDSSILGSNRHRMISIIIQALKAVDDDCRAIFLKTAIQNGSSISTMIGTMFSLGYPYGMYGHGPGNNQAINPLVDMQTILDIEQILLEKINDAKQNGTLIEVPYLPSVVSYWEKLIPDKKVIPDWIAEACIDDENLLTLLEMGLNPSRNQVLSESFSSTTLQFPIDWIEKYVDIEWLRSRVEEIRSRQTLTANNKVAIEIFIQCYNQGKERKNRKNEEETDDDPITIANEHTMGSPT